MFVPSYNNFSVCTCQKCRTPFYDHFSVSICRYCRQKEDEEEKEKIKEQTSFLNEDEFLLPVYYKRKIELTFQKSESKDIANKYIQLYTVLMIPNMENWLKEKLEETKKKMEKNGLEKVSFKLIGGYSEICDRDIEYYSQKKIIARYITDNILELPFIAEYNDGTVEKIYKSFWTGIKSMVKNMDWLQLIMKILVVIMIIFLLATGAFSLVVFVSEIISGHYSHSIGPFALFAVGVFGSWAMIKILRDIFFDK